MSPVRMRVRARRRRRQDGGYSTLARMTGSARRVAIEVAAIVLRYASSLAQAAAAAAI